MNLPKILHLAYRSRMKTRNWHRIVRAMAMVVVFCTTYALILPAITMESGTVCGITAHSHTEQCYETATVLHSHDESCYSRTAICGIEEHPAHSHLAECTGFVPTLICELPEEGHRHNAACYSYEQGLVCELEESEGHTHSEACWQTDLICGLSENQEVTVTNLICGYEEHVHEESCYPAPTETTAGETLPAAGDPNADVETESDWLESFASAALTEDWSENLLAIARCQLGYAESKRNLSYDEAGNIFGYTRYGAWYGQPYGRWDAMFVSFCLHYAGVEGIPYGSDTAQWLETLTEEGLYLPKAEYIPVPGDLVFLDRDYDEEADHVGIVSSVDSDTGMVTLIAGDWDHRVDWVEVDETAILGYVPLPEEPTEEPESYLGQSEEGIAAEVLLRAALPEGAELTVTPIAEEREDYAAMAAQVSEAVAESIEKLTLLDLSFYASGEYLPVSDSATVTLYFEGDIFQNRQVKVFHLTENGPTELNSTATTFTTFSLREENTQTMLTFETEGFSVFAVVEVTDTVTYEKVMLDENYLEGSYYIACQHGTRYVTNNMYGTEALQHSEINELGSIWTFEQVVKYSNQYRIKSTQSDGTTVYMSMDSSNGHMSLKSTAEDASVFTIISVDGNKYKFNVGTYYLNEYNGHNNPYGFKGYHVSGDAGNNLTLYYSEPTVSVKDLDGKSFALVNRYHERAMTADSATEQASGKAALAAKKVELIEKADGTYVNSLGDIPLWTFTAVDAENGIYNISTEVDGVTKYLNLTTETTGDLTVIETVDPQELTVTKWADGNGICISNGKTAINASGSDEDRDFWCHTDATPLMLCKITEQTSSFNVSYQHTDGRTYNILVCLKDSLGNDLIVDNEVLANITKTLNSGETWTFATTDLEIEDYVYTEAKLEGTTSVVSVNTNDGGPFRFYDSNGGYYTRPQNGAQSITLHLVYKTTRSVLNYDLNVPTPNGGSGWHNAPRLDAISQDVASDAQNLLTVQNGNEVGSFVYNTLSGGRGPGVANYYNQQNTLRKNAGTLTADNYLAPGDEYRFIGWKVTVDGVDHFISPNATVVLLEDGQIQINDGETVLTVPTGTILVGQWDYISSVVLFFVNYGDTMLEKQDNQPIIGYGVNYYTEVVALGHLYDNDDSIDSIAPGKTEVIVDGVTSEKDSILRSNDALIQAEIVEKFNPAKEGTQIVIDAVSRFNTETNQFEYVHVTNINQNQLEASVGQYLQNDPNQNTQVQLDSAYIDKSEINADNYKLYWYLQKLVEDEGWHIDGVLVAKTQPMEIYKTFSGLTTDQADNAIQNMTFPLNLIRTVDSQDRKDDYTTLQAASSQSGVYTYDGRPGTGNIFKWTLESVQGQRYTFEEDGYDVTGYDCSSLVSVHYADGAVVYKYNTDATYTDATGNTDAITDLFADKPLVGGQVESIIFANFYTQTGTGMFSISKVADDIGQVRLPGAEFTLTQGDAVISNQTTNENGAAHFSDLEPGTYTLTETKAPTGYQSLNTIWTVVVAKDNDKVTVTIQKEGETTTQTLYDSSNGGILEDGVYLIQNTPQNTTVTVNKDFSDQLTDDEMRELENYAIVVKDGDGTDVKTLTWQDATAITGSINAYTWTIDLNCGSTYQFVESGYSHKNYLDTVVSASVNGVAQTVTKSEDNTTASFSMVKGEAADTVNITNDYTNTFDLRIHKVNATAGTGEDPNMSGVKFNIYGDFQFHQKPSDDTAASIPYTYNGTEGTAWYIGTTEATNDDGYTLFRDMHLTSGTDTFLYVIDETDTPAGFVKLDEPIVRVVRVNGGDPNYSNGVYTLTVENFKPDLATVTVTATKQWELPEGMSTVPVTLTLYQKSADNAVSPVQMVTLDGIANTTTEKDGITASINGWTVVWSGLTYADGATPNVYYVAETPMDGYNTSYNTHVSTNSVGTQQIEMALAEGYNLKRSVTITNSSGYELPSTGSLGVGWIYILGLGLMGAALWLHRLDVIKKRQGGVNSS